MNDDMILEDNGVTDYCTTDFIRNIYIKIKAEFIDGWRSIKYIQGYVDISDLKIIKPDEHKEVKPCNNNL